MVKACVYLCRQYCFIDGFGEFSECRCLTWSFSLVSQSRPMLVKYPVAGCHYFQPGLHLPAQP